jgi:hypothetical protein
MAFPGMTTIFLISRSKKQKTQEVNLSPFAFRLFYFNDNVSVRPITSIESLSSLSNQPIAR